MSDNVIGPIQRIINRGFISMGLAFARAVERKVRLALGIRYAKRRIYDYDMLLDMQDPGLSRGLMLFGQRELDMKRMLELYIKPSMRVFDVGGNIGYYPLLDLSLLRGSGDLIVVEPVPENVTLLKKNLALNGKAQVPVLQAAVSNVASTKSFHMSEHSNLGTFHPEGSVNEFLSGATIDVETLTIPILAERYGAPDLMRMDIEGHEVAVLNGMLEDMRAGKYAPTIVFEVHQDRYGPSNDMAGLLGELFALGYATKLVSSSTDKASEWFVSRGYKAQERIATDAIHRSLFANLKNADAVDAICNGDNVRTVVLARQ